MGKWAMTLSAWVAVSLWLPAVQAAEDNLYISGTLVNEPCVLDEEDQIKFEGFLEKLPDGCKNELGAYFNLDKH